LPQFDATVFIRFQDHVEQISHLPSASRLDPSRNQADISTKFRPDESN